VAADLRPGGPAVAGQRATDTHEGGAGIPLPITPEQVWAVAGELTGTAKVPVAALGKVLATAPQLLACR
jgi:hypothetical protein